MEVLVGAGGWAYFQVPGEGSLEAYSRAFDFVEVNSTYYETPPMPQVRRWRSQVPDGFQFALRVHRSVGESAFARNRPNVKGLQASLAMARTLRAQFLHILWPSKVPVEEKSLANLRDLVGGIDPGEHTFCLEVRAADRGRTRAALVALVEDLGMVHAVDLSREFPAADSGYLYTRLFGPAGDNQYQFTNKELEAIAEREEEVGAHKAVFTFHGVRMYKDAARFKTFKATGRFPPVTMARGLEGLAEVLQGEVKFPTSREALINAHGWNVVEMGNGGQARAVDLLRSIPEGTYSGLEAVLGALDRG